MLRIRYGPGCLCSPLFAWIADSVMIRTGIELDEDVRLLYPRQPRDRMACLAGLRGSFELTISVDRA